MARFVIACIIATTVLSIPAQEKKESIIEILYDPPEKPPKNIGSNGLCLNAPAKGGKDTRTNKTIRELLGPDVQRIKIHYYSKRWGSFEQAKSHLLWLLAARSQDGTMYRYQPWAEAVSPSIIATIEYKRAKGELEVGGVGAHLCFQDEKGLHWWT